MWISAATSLRFVNACNIIIIITMMMMMMIMIILKFVLSAVLMALMKWFVLRHSLTELGWLNRMAIFTFQFIYKMICEIAFTAVYLWESE